jgi:hypothetical protein
MSGLAEVERSYQALVRVPDLVGLGGLRATLGAVAANRQLEQDPVWLLIVAPPSSGKTEIVEACKKLPDVHPAATLTEPSLLSGSPKKEHAKEATGGLLREMGQFGILLHKDFGSVLSMHRDSRSQVLAALREVYDGSWDRPVGVDGGKVLHWQGKAGLIAGCTPTIDRHHAVMSQMGDRFLLYRLPAVSRGEQLRHGLSRHGVGGLRRQLAEAVADFFDGLDPEREPRELEEEDIDRLEALALFATAARSAVERDGFSRDIELVPDLEAPARMGNQLRALLDGLDVIGVPRDEAWWVVRKAALDSVPALRLSALEALHGADWQTTTEVELAIGYPNKTTRRTLEDLTAHRLVERQLAEQEGLPHKWRLTEEPTQQLTAIRTWTEMSEGGPRAPKTRSESQKTTSLNTSHSIDDDFSVQPPQAGPASLFIAEVDVGGDSVDGSPTARGCISHPDGPHPACRYCRELGDQ